jgi:hypothetical protein
MLSKVTLPDVLTELAADDLERRRRRAAYRMTELAWRNTETAPPGSLGDAAARLLDDADPLLRLHGVTPWYAGLASPAWSPACASWRRRRPIPGSGSSSAGSLPPWADSGPRPRKRSPRFNARHRAPPAAGERVGLVAPQEVAREPDQVRPRPFHHPGQDRLRRMRYRPGFPTGSSSAPASTSRPLGNPHN